MAMTGLMESSQLSADRQIGLSAELRQVAKALSRDPQRALRVDPVATHHGRRTGQATSDSPCALNLPSYQDLDVREKTEGRPLVNNHSEPSMMLCRRATAKQQNISVHAQPVMLSFDVEEHFRIEAAAGLEVGASLRASYRAGLSGATRWILHALARRQIRATFFILGHLARDYPSLVQLIHHAGHEIASHGWGHQRLHVLTPAKFRDDVRRSKEALEDLTGQEVLGYRAPTFSIVRETAWAIDVLSELGFAYDSSIYPIRHDRYGVPNAPITPYVVHGSSGSILEIPPLTYRLPGINLPAAGGGYFRLFPPFVMEHAIRQSRRSGTNSTAMLYFHPWEFDPGQPKLPLSRLNRFRTYVGIHRSRARFEALLSRHQFTNAAAVVSNLNRDCPTLPHFHLVERHKV